MKISIIGNSYAGLVTGTYLCQDEYKTAQGSNALIIATEWNQFRNLNLLKIKKIFKTPILIDLKNLYEPKKMKEIGFIYEGVGRL